MYNDIHMENSKYTILYVCMCLYSMLFSSKLDDVDDNDGGTIMTTMKNNDVYTTYNNAIDINPMEKNT